MDTVRVCLYSVCVGRERGGEGVGRWYVLAVVGVFLIVCEEMGEDE